MSNGAGQGDGQDAGQQGKGTPGEGLSGAAADQQGGQEGGAVGAEGDGKGAGASDAGTPGEGLSGGKGSAPAGQDGSGSGDGAGKDGEGAGKDGDQKGEGGKDLLGVPESGYQEFKVPEGATVDDGMMKLATDAFKEMGLSQIGAQKIVDLYAQVAEYQDAKFEEFRSGQIVQNRDTWKKDPEFGGDNIEQSQIWIKKAVDVLFKNDPYNTMAYLVTTGEEFHPGLMRAFAIAGKALSDDTFDGGGDGSHKRSEDNRPLSKRMFPDLP